MNDITQNDELNELNIEITRLDEHLKMLDIRYNRIEERLEQKLRECKACEYERLDKSVERLTEHHTELEVKIESLQQRTTSSENRWKLTFDFVYKAAWVIIVCYLLYKLNLNTIPLP